MKALLILICGSVVIALVSTVAVPGRDTQALNDARRAQIEATEQARYFFQPEVSGEALELIASYRARDILFLGHWEADGIVNTAKGLEMLEAILNIEDWLMLNNEPLRLICAPDKFRTTAGASPDQRRNRIWFYYSTPGPSTVIHEFGHFIDWWLWAHDLPDSVDLFLEYGWATDENGKHYWVWPREAGASDYAIDGGMWEDWADSFVVWVYAQHGDHPGGRFRSIDDGRQMVFNALFRQSEQKAAMGGNGG